MELKRDLLVIQQKSVFRISMGILFFIISIAWIVDLAISGNSKSPFDWFFFVIFVLNGLVHSIEGFGFSLARLFGKAFILIDNERIAIKTGVLAREQSISWVDIKSISYKPIRFKVARKDDTSMTFNLSKLDYSLVKDIKNTINVIADEKGLLIS